jgi:hypothetical protein
LHDQHLRDVHDAEEGKDLRLVKQIPYRTDQKFFSPMLPRRDFRERGTVVFREYSYQNYLNEIDVGGKYLPSEKQLMEDGRLRELVDRIANENAKKVQ